MPCTCVIADFGEIDVGMRGEHRRRLLHARDAIARSGFSRTGSPASGRIVSTGGSLEKSGIGSLAVRFWNAAFLRANIVIARL